MVCRMNLRQSESTRTVPAPAKLNLFLDVLGRQDDGYHELETLMVPLRFWDSLSFTPTRARGSGEVGEISFELAHPVGPANSTDPHGQVPAGSENLVVRALELLRQRTGCDLGARVQLMKRIPASAGMGGGSSDAAAALQLGNLGWRLGLSHNKLSTIAAELGSDVPFFLSSGAAICRGRGEQVERIPSILPLNVVIVKPSQGLATADVYRAWDDQATSVDRIPNLSRGPRRVNELVESLRRGDLDAVGRAMTNQLQAAAASLSPAIERVQSAFARLDFVGHQLTGSGTAYFGICRHARHTRRLASILGKLQLGLVYTVRTCR
jgi:4-diphosphocytidyl-2-C-methyl-D-erythritol kinase